MSNDHFLYSAEGQSNVRRVGDLWCDAVTGRLNTTTVGGRDMITEDTHLTERDWPA